MKTLLQLIKKNFLVLFRAKGTSLIIVLGPLFLIFLLGLAFDNTNTYTLNIGAYTPTPTEAVSFFLDRLAEKQFHIIRLEKEGECQERIKDGTLHACLVFPEGFSFQQKGKNEISFYVDYSRINLVYLLIETLTNKVSAQAKDVSINLTNVLLEKLDKTRQEIFLKRPLLSGIGKKNKEVGEHITNFATSVDRFDIALAPLVLAQIDDSGIDQSIVALSRFIELARVHINAAERAAATFTNPDGSNPVMEELRQAKSALKALEQAVSNELAPFQGMLGTVQQELAKVTAHLAAVDEKVKGIAALKQKTAETAHEISGLATSVLTDVQSLQATFETIDQNIGSIQIQNAADIVTPLATSIKAVNAQASHLNYLFPSLFMLVIMFMSILLGTTLVLAEKNSPAFFRNAITPVSDITFVTATWVTCFLLVAAQALLMLALAGTFFSVPLFPAFLQIGISTVLAISFFSVLGMSIGYIFTHEETATIAAVSTGTLFLFFSQAIFPLESLPSLVFALAQYSPYLLSEHILRKLVFYKLGFAATLHEMLFLFGYTVFLLLFVYLLQTAIRRHFAHRWIFLQKRKIIPFMHFFSSAKEEPETYVVPDEIGDVLDKERRVYKKKQSKHKK